MFQPSSFVRPPLLGPALALALSPLLALAASAPGALAHKAGLAEKSPATLQFQEQVAQHPELAPEALLYQSLKENGQAIPAWLDEMINRPGGGSRQGGETYETAVPIAFTPGGSYTDSGTTTGAVNDYDYTTAPLACQFGSWYTSSFNSTDVVYTFTLPDGYEVSADICATSFDSALGIVDANGTLVAYNDDNGSVCTAHTTGSAIVGCCLPAGTYYVVVDGYSAGNGTYTLNVSFGASPCVVLDPCEEYAQHTTQLTAPATATGTNLGEPHVYGGLGGDIGFTIDLPSDGLWDFDTCAPGTAAALDLYLFDRSPCEGGVLISSNLGGTCASLVGAGRLLEQNLAAGSYHLLVGNSGTTEGAFELVVQPTPPRPTEGGPDALGYHWTSSLGDEGPEFGWVDISALGTPVTLTDDSNAGPFPIGFAFPFYEAAQTDVYIGSNGILTFGAGSSARIPTALPNAATPNNLIAGFWDDLNPTLGGTIHYYTDTDNNRFIVQFTAIPDYGNAAAPNSFQFILHPDGRILLQYLTILGDRNICGVGTDNTTGTIGLNVRYQGAGALIADGVAIEIVPMAGDFMPPAFTHTALPDVETELVGGYPVSVLITDESGVSSANLLYSVDGGAEQSLALAHGAGDSWTATLPHQEAGALVSYHFSAVDNSVNHNVGTSASWTFDVVSLAWAPQNLAASDGGMLSTSITWLPPVDPDLLEARFGDVAPRSQGEFIEALVQREGLSKEQAQAVWDEWFSNAGRVFLTYQVRRNGSPIGTTTNLSFVDNEALGADPDVVYTYSVVAQYTAGTSVASNEDSGFWITGATQGGPDAFGYAWRNSGDDQGPAFQWTDISAMGTPISPLTDDGNTGPYALGFDFPFYDTTYTDVYVASNGFLTFGTGNGSLTNQELPNTTTPNNVLAAFWDDLAPHYAGSTIHTYADAANQRFIVQWHVPPYGSPTPYTFLDFQAILSASGDITVQWLNLVETDIIEATCGIENTDGTMGLTYNYNGTGAALADQVAVRFTYPLGPEITHTPLGDVETEIAGTHNVVATLTSDLGVASARVLYSLNGGVLQSVAMVHGAGDTWTGAIPHQPAGTSVAYSIEATDSQTNVRASQTWTFHLVSNQWPPINLVASDGLIGRTDISWLPPVNPADLARWFGDDSPSDQDEALERLMARHGMTKDQALAVWRGLVQPAGREFVQYRLYRDDEMLTETTELSFVDNAESGSELGVIYSYSVTAVFTSGESQHSVADNGSWGVGPTFGGPDAFGYSWRSSLDPTGPAYQWVDIAGQGTAVTLGDDDFTDTAVPIGFNFPYYGEPQTELYISSNGFISFGAGSTALGNQNLPIADTPNNLIAAFWDDLDPGDGVGTIEYLSDPEAGRFIVQYTGVPDFGDIEALNTFQIILAASGAITVNFEELLGDRTSCSTGIENVDGTMGLGYVYNNTGGMVGDQIAILFTPVADCEPVECTGTAEVEPNEGWADGTYNVIRCGETVCGTVLESPNDTDSDWFLYSHFGGNITVSLDVSDFDGRVTLRELADGGQILAQGNVFPRCYDESFAVQGLQGGSYYIVVEHAGDPDVTTPQSYALTVTCSGDPCSGHLPVECAGTPEAEPNEGWNATPPNANYGTLEEGQTICGSVWAHDGQRDMDWYRFHLDNSQEVTFNAEIDAFDAALYLTDFDPAGGVLLEVNDSPACAPETATITLAAGNYFIAIGHSSMEGVDEPQNYALTFGTPAVPEDPCTNYQDLGNFHDIVQMSRPAPMRLHHDGTGCPGGVSSPGRDEVVRLVLSRTTDLRVDMTGQGDADEVILLLGNCAQPATSCGAAVNAAGAGAGGESLIFNNLPAGDYYVVADFAGPGETHSYQMAIIDMESAVAEGRELSFELKPVHPNPFNPTTTLNWTQPRLAAATLTVHDLRGALVEQLELGVRGAGAQSFVWDAARFGSGTYFLTLATAGETKTVKAVLVK